MGTLIGLTVFVPIYLRGGPRPVRQQVGPGADPADGRRRGRRDHRRPRAVARGPLQARAARRDCLVAGGRRALVIAGWTGSLSLVAIEALLAIISLGIGTMLPVTTVAVQNAVAPHQLGTTTAAIGFFRSLGGALLVAGFGAIVLGFGPLPQSEEAPGALLAAADAALVARFSWMFVMAAAAFALTFLMLLMMEERPLRGRPEPAS